MGDKCLNEELFKGEQPSKYLKEMLTVFHVREKDLEESEIIKYMKKKIM